MAERAPSAPITTSALTSIVLPSGLSHKFQIERAWLNQINYILDLTVACPSVPTGKRGQQARTLNRQQENMPSL